MLYCDVVGLQAIIETHALPKRGRCDRQWIHSAFDWCFKSHSRVSSVTCSCCDTAKTMEQAIIGQHGDCVIYHYLVDVSASSVFKTVFVIFAFHGLRVGRI